MREPDFISNNNLKIYNRMKDNEDNAYYESSFLPHLMLTNYVIRTSSIRKIQSFNE